MIDLFISHASEDKGAIARPLAATLVDKGLSVWYDEQSLTLGDSLAREIDRGLADCRFGVVILSPSFFAKEWPRQELDALVAREANERTKRVLPIWHDIDAAEVARHSPLLAGKLSISTDRGLEAVADAICRAVTVGSVQPARVYQPRPANIAQEHLGRRLKVESSFAYGYVPGQPLRIHPRVKLVNRGSRAVVLSFQLKFYLEPSDPRKWVRIPEGSHHEHERIKIEGESFAKHDLNFTFLNHEQYGGPENLLKRSPYLEIVDHITDESIEVQIPTPD